MEKLKSRARKGRYILRTLTLRFLQFIQPVRDLV